MRALLDLGLLRRGGALGTLVKLHRLLPDRLKLGGLGRCGPLALASELPYRLRPVGLHLRLPLPLNLDSALLELGLGLPGNGLGLRPRLSAFRDLSPDLALGHAFAFELNHRGVRECLELLLGELLSSDHLRPRNLSGLIRLASRALALSGKREEDERDMSDLDS